MSREEFQALRARVQPVCHRTLRRQVVEYIRYTNRIPITQDFTPSAEEERLYNAVSAYLQREESLCAPVESTRPDDPGAQKNPGLFVVRHCQDLRKHGPSTGNAHRTDRRRGAPAHD